MRKISKKISRMTKMGLGEEGEEEEGEGEEVELASDLLL